MKKYLFLTLLMSISTLSCVYAQGWWKNYPATYCDQFIETPDSNYLLFGVKVDSMRQSYSLTKINADGDVVSFNEVPFARYYEKLFLLSTGKLVIIFPPPPGPVNPATNFLLIHRLNAYGVLEKVDTILAIDKAVSSITMQNDSLFACSNNEVNSLGQRELIFFNINQKAVVQRTSLGVGYTSAIVRIDNSLVCYFTSNSIGIAEKITIDTNRQISGRQFIYFIYLTTDNKGNSFFSGGDDKIIKFDKLGRTIWERNIPTGGTMNISSIVFLPNDHFVFILNSSNYDPITRIYSFKPNLLKCNSQGDTLWSKALPAIANIQLHGKNVVVSRKGGFLMGLQGNVQFTPTQKFTNAQVIKFDANGSLGTLFQNNIKGKIQRNSNNNCLPDTNNTPITNSQIEATRTDGQVYRASTDRLGNYHIICDSGNYTIKAVVPNALWQSCTPSVSRRLSTTGATDTVNFLLKPLSSCPLLTIDIATNGFRRCFNNAIFVNYCNNGTSPAANAYVDIRLDPLIQFTSATRPIASQNGNIFRFNLGTIGIGECGNFSVNGRVRCGDSTRLGQTLCNEAHIYPDSSCLPIGTFSGANLTISGSCVGDSVQFIVKNIGTAASQSKTSVVIEDEVLFMRNSINGLVPNGTFSRKYKANGSTWRMIIEQETNHPTSQFPTAFVEGCGINSNGTSSTGFGTAFGNDDATPSVSTLCRPIIGSYDPNDKQGFPTGYKSEHFIRQNQDLEYVIRFQNTGTDTAFLVVIRDTLSDVLDISNLEFGSSSHPYEATIYGKNILKFSFQNINLPDSFRNVNASNGFVKFRIKQKKDLLIGTKIENKAGIYFDFNDPIITNKTLHTIAKDVLITAIIEPNILPNYLTINVSPNPFVERATFELLELNQPFNTQLNSIQFEVYDVMGRLLRSEKISNYRFDFDRKDLMNGLYFFKIKDNGKIIGKGKLVIGY